MNKKGGIGSSIIRFVISLAIEQNKTCACKLITVDAYNQSLGFYERIGFSYFSESDKGKDTRQMFLDLTPIINAAFVEDVTF
jgi:hypothetical protein